MPGTDLQQLAKMDIEFGVRVASAGRMEPGLSNAVERPRCTLGLKLKLKFLITPLKYLLTSTYEENTLIPSASENGRLKRI